MSSRAAVVLVPIAAGVLACSHAATVQQRPIAERATESTIDVGGASLYVREIGRGRPILVLHGGPDFDHRYFLPELDALGDEFRLIYYDQRGRGLSAEGVRPEDVTLASDVSDVDMVRQRLGLDAPVLLGHSWGAVLALEYARRHPENVSALVLMNPAPASVADLDLLRKSYSEKLGRSALERQNEIVAGEAYQRGDPAAVAARYRIHFRPAVKDPGQYEMLMARMTATFHAQGAEGILKARRVEDRLMLDTWQVPGYDLFPHLRELTVPTLVIAGNEDFIPLEVAEHIAAAMPNARLITLKGCAHFAYLECPTEARTALRQFLGR